MSTSDKQMEENNSDCNLQLKNSGNWKESLKLFHVNRTIQISHLPPDVTEEELQEILKFLDTAKIEINHTAHTAKVTLVKPESFDPILLSHEVPTSFKGQEIAIKYDTVDNFLCIANLPLDFTESQFIELVEKFGPVDRCFLIYDHLTDKSKGYGLVQYCSRAVACQARNLLHEKEIMTTTLYCDWLDHKLVTYETLYSKCIYVDYLPNNYCDLGNFRKIFSLVINPLYCQLAHKNDKTTVFGLIEYSTSRDAALSCDKLRNYKLEDNFIRTFLTIPSVPAVKLLNKLVVETSTKKKNAKGLLPTPTFPIHMLSHMHIPQIWNMGQSNGFLHTSQLLRSPLSSFVNQQSTSSRFATEGNIGFVNSTLVPPIIPDSFGLFNQTDFTKKLLKNKTLHQKNQMTKSVIGQGRPVTKPLMPHQQSNIMDNSSNSTHLFSPSSDNALHLLKNIFKSSSPRQNLINSFSFSPSAASVIRHNHPLFSPEMLSGPLPVLRQQLQVPVSPNMLASYADNSLKLDSPHRQGSNHWRTPRQKRKLHNLLPLPEQSPENNYIGQHSQGIGGHYADSYFRAKKIRPSKEI